MMTCPARPVNKAQQNNTHRRRWDVARSRSSLISWIPWLSIFRMCIVLVWFDLNAALHLFTLSDTSLPGRRLDNEHFMTWSNDDVRQLSQCIHIRPVMTWCLKETRSTTAETHLLERFLMSRAILFFLLLSYSCIIYELLIKASDRINKQLEHMFGCTCACRRDGHGFNHSEEAGRCRQGGGGREQGERANKASEFPPPGSFCSSRTAKVKIKDKAANKKTKTTVIYLSQQWNNSFRVYQNLGFYPRFVCFLFFLNQRLIL